MPEECLIGGGKATGELGADESHYCRMGGVVVVGGGKSHRFDAASPEAGDIPFLPTAKGFVDDACMVHAVDFCICSQSKTIVRGKGDYTDIQRLLPL